MPNPMPSSDTHTRSREVHSGRVLADDEDIVWQGAPTILGVARKILWADYVLAYFVLLVAVDLVRAAFGQIGLGEAFWPLLPAVIVGTILLALARMIARSTRYVATTRRFVIRYGAALPRSLSIPLSQVHALSVSQGRSGRGDIAFRTKGDLGVSSLKLWPHVRAWQKREPMLRDIAEAGLVATRLSRLLSDAENHRNAVTQRLATDRLPDDAFRKAG